MRNPQLHALNIGTLALWLSVTGFGAVAVWVPGFTHPITISSADDTTGVAEDFSIGDSTDDPAGETLQADAPAKFTSEPLPAPPALTPQPHFAPLPEIPDFPVPVVRTPAGAGRSIAARLAAGRTPGPSYPPEARRAGQTGTVVVQFTVDAAGDIADASVYTSSNSNLLDREALRTVRAWKFPPGDIMTLIRPIVFQLP
ncbi:MAG: energy transducer TonB [Luteolibacter sp.]|uniref:energy transducer TonB n=1 Tax=Luteolibacter sp. TaxID=1962973 RepID=UPI00326784D3